MKKISFQNKKWQILGLTLGLFITLYAIDKLVYQALSTVDNKVVTGSQVGKYNYYLEVKDSVDILVFGSSRAKYHIVTTDFAQTAFNMGVVNKKLCLSAYCIQHLPPNKKQTVLLNFDPEELFDLDYKGEDLLYIRNKYHQDPFLRNEMKQLSLTNPLENFLWSLNYNGKVLGMLKNYVQPLKEPADYWASDTLKNELKHQTEIIGDKKKENVKGELNPIAKEKLNEIIRYCKRNKKELIIFTSPKREQLNEKFLQYCSDYFSRQQVKYINYSNLIPYEKCDKCWYDELHLSTEGAHILTRQIAKDFDIQLREY